MTDGDDYAAPAPDDTATPAMAPDDHFEAEQAHLVRASRRSRASKAMVSNGGQRGIEVMPLRATLAPALHRAKSLRREHRAFHSLSRRFGA